jgi:hypothetical protein
MDKNDALTQVTEDNLAFVEKEFEASPHPIALHEISQRLAFQKTASQRVQQVVKYDSNCKYKVGDQIYREYDESLTVSSKTIEHFKGAVVLKVISKVFYKDFQCEMIEVDYSGGGLFRKYVDYMKKTKTQVLLPSNCEGLGLEPEIMEKAEDPRLSELPMTERDMKALEKNLRTALSKSDKFFSWNDYFHLQKNVVAVPEEKVKDIEAQIQETRQSAATAEVVAKLFGLEPSHDLFDITCLSLNYTLDKKYKKEFVFVSSLDWGKWHLKTVLNSYLDGLPLAAPTARLPEMETAEKPSLSTFHDFPLKIYLTWREVFSGSVKVPKSLNKDLSHAREYTFTDAEENKNYTVHFYPTGSFFLGLKDYFRASAIPQGTSLTLEKKGPLQFTFWLKKSKKKISVPQLVYDPAKDQFAEAGEEAFTFALPNKIIFLEKNTLAQLLPLYEQRDERDLRELLLLIFRTFGLESDDHSLHFLRAYHLIDVLKQTTQEDVETTLINSPEFSASEKKKGVFYYREPKAEVEEVKPEAPAEAVEMPPLEAGPEAVEEAEAPPPEIEEEAEAPIPIPIRAEALEKPRAEAPPAAREKPLKKKRGKAEGERGPRPRKSERRVIEERIELAESEMEALAAVKEKEETEAEAQAAKDKKEEIKTVATKEAAFGFFADKLKSALEKKKKEVEKK